MREEYTFYTNTLATNLRVTIDLLMLQLESLAEFAQQVRLSKVSLFPYGFFLR